MYNYIIDDQFAYKKGINLLWPYNKYQHIWLKSLEEGEKKQSQSSLLTSVKHLVMSRMIFCLTKIKKIPVNPYITNWLIDFLSNRSKRVKIDGVTTKFLNINRGVPQGTVLGPIMFTVMVNDIKAVNPLNDLSKFADDAAIMAPGARIQSVMK